MAKEEDRPVDAGLAAQKGKDDAALVEWWKQRFEAIAAIPQEIARLGAYTPTIRQLTRLDDDERRKNTRAMIAAFARLSKELQDLLGDVRRKSFGVDSAVLTEDQRLVDQILPSVDERDRTAFPPSPR